MKTTVIIEFDDECPRGLKPEDFERAIRDSVSLFRPASVKVSQQSEEPFGPEWVASKREESERGFGKKS